MGHFSDSAHMDTCAGRFCNTLELRSNMHKIDGRRGWFCTPCITVYKKLKTPQQYVPKSK